MAARRNAAELPKPVVRGVPAESFRPLGIRNGWIIGTAVTYAADGTEVDTPARYHLPTGEFVDLPPSTLRPRGGNGQGWMVGWLPNERLGLLTDAGTVDLPYVEPHRTAVGDAPVAVSDDGRIIAGQSEDAQNVIQAVVWNCR